MLARNMETVTFFQQRLSARMSSTITVTKPPEEHAPPRRLRSCKRRALVEREANATPGRGRASLPAQKRLRRMQAYSDLDCSTRPRDIPTIPISVHEKYWLENAVIKAQKILHDKENAEAVLQRVAAAPWSESLSTPFFLEQNSLESRPRVFLNHKNKAEDLRSKYSSPTSSPSAEQRRLSDSLHRKSKSEDLRSKYSSPTPTDGERATPDFTPSLDQSRPSDANGSGIGSPRETIQSPKSQCSEPGYLYCVCQQPFDHSLGEMVACDICDGWFHLGCVGQDQHDAAYFEDRSFYCPRCEAFAYQEIVLEEDGSADS